RRLPVGPAAQVVFSEVRPGIEPGLSAYRADVLPKHLQTNFKMIPDHPAGGARIEPSLSWLSPRRLRRWTTGSSDRGGGRTHRITRLRAPPGHHAQHGRRWSLVALPELRTRP